MVFYDEFDFLFYIYIYIHSIPGCNQISPGGIIKSDLTRLDLITFLRASIMNIISHFQFPGSNSLYSLCYRSSFVTFPTFQMQSLSYCLLDSLVCSRAILCASQCQSWFLYHGKFTSALVIGS